MAPPTTEDAKMPLSLKLARRLLFPSLTDLIFIFIIVLAFLVPADGWQRLLADGDTGLHIRVGDAIVAGRHVPTQDLFSFSRPGQEWFAFEWLSEVIFSFLHSLFGLKGVVLFSGALLAATFTVLLRYLLWLGANSLIALALVLMAINTSLIHFLARPHLGGLLIAYHAHLSDCMILLMPFVLVLEHSRFAPLRGAVALAITPPVVLCLMKGSPWNAVVPVALMITMALAAISPDLPSDTAARPTWHAILGGDS